MAVSGLAQMAHEIGLPQGELVDEDGLAARHDHCVTWCCRGMQDDSCRVLDLVWQTVGDVRSSVMNQYTPNALMREQAATWHDRDAR